MHHDWRNICYFLQSREMRFCSTKKQCSLSQILHWKKHRGCQIHNSGRLLNWLLSSRWAHKTPSYLNKEPKTSQLPASCRSTYSPNATRYPTSSKHVFNHKINLLKPSILETTLYNGAHNLHARFRLAGIGATVAFSSLPKSIWTPDATGVTKELSG